MEYFVTMKNSDIKTIRIKKKSICDVYSEEMSYGPFESKKKAREFITNYVDGFFVKREDKYEK